MASNNMTIFHNHGLFEQVVLDGIKKINFNEDIKQYFSKVTVEEKKEKLQEYKKVFKDFSNKLSSNSDKSLIDYFQAYEKILEFRQFILGDLGKINYLLVIRNTKNEIRQITIGSQTFKDLIFDNENKIVGLSKDSGQIRFNINFKNKLIELIKNEIEININNDCSSFNLINTKLGAKKQFLNGPIFKSYIQHLQSVKRRGRYNFTIDLVKDKSSKDEAAIFKYNIIKVQGNPASSSVFSALGKYFADEMAQKQSMKQSDTRNIIDPTYPNVGNLTELYILAKQRLNNKKNNFPKRRRVSGDTIFKLYNEVKSNTDPFYSGGDVLINQVKSFLGSLPSLTSFATIKKSINDFYKALNEDDYAKIEKKLEKLLLQQQSANKISKQEKNLSTAIFESFKNFFDDIR